MVLYIAAVGGQHGQLHVVALLGNHAGGPQLVVPQGALIAAQVQVEHIGADKVVAGTNLGHSAVLKLQNDGDGAVKFQVGAHFAALGIHADHFVLHKPAHGVYRVAAAGQQRAAANGLFAGPFIAGNVAGHTVEVVGFGIGQLADKVLLQLLGGHEQGIVVQHIAHQSLYARFPHGFVHAQGVLPGQGDGLFQQDVLVGLSRLDGLLAVHVVGGADHHDVHIGVLQGLVIIRVHLATVAQIVLVRLGAALFVAAGHNGPYLGMLVHFKRPNVLAGYPARANDHYAILFHVQFTPFKCLFQEIP